MQASKKLSPATLAAYEALAASAQFCEPLGDEAVIQLSLPALNDLLRLVGLPDIEEEGVPPADFAGENVLVADPEPAQAANAAPWFVGSIAEIVDLDGVAVIACPAAEEQFSKQVFVKLDDLRAEFRGDLSKHIGAEIMFPLNADEEDNLWAGPPVFAKNRSFTGAISSWKGHFGFIKCKELDGCFADGVYIHGNAAVRGHVPTNLGQQVTFGLHVSDKGKPQASSPRPVGGGKGPMFAENPAKRPRLMQQPLAKGGSAWSPSLGAPAGGKDHGAFKGKDSWGKGGWNDSGKPAWGGMRDAGWVKGGKGGKGGKAGEEWHEGTIISYDTQKGFGFVTGSAFGEDVYVHTKVVEACGAYNGAFVQFQVHISKQGKPQASNPMYVL